jgi:hypothetical protein
MVWVKANTDGTITELGPNFAATPDSTIFAQTVVHGQAPGRFIVHEQLAWVHRLWQRAMNHRSTPAPIGVTRYQGYARSTNPIGLPSPARAKGTCRLFFTTDTAPRDRSPTLRVRNVADIRHQGDAAAGIRIPDPFTGLAQFELSKGATTQVTYVAVGAVDPRLRAGVMVPSAYDDPFDLVTYLAREASTIAREIGADPDTAVGILRRFFNVEFAESSDMADLFFGEPQFDLSEGELKPLILRIVPNRPGRMMFAVALIDVESPDELAAVSLPMVLQADEKGAVLFAEPEGDEDPTALVAEFED